MMKETEITTSRFMLMSLFICLVLGIISQVEAFRSTFRPILYASWMAAIIVYMIQFRHRILISKNARVLVTMTAIIFLWRFILILFGKGNVLPQVGTMLLIDLAVFLYGSWLAERKIGGTKLAIILVSYSVVCVIFSIYLFRTYFTTIVDWITTTNYQYISKNSAAQLLAHAVIFLLFLYPVAYRKQTILNQLIRLLMISILILVICLLRCRTAILALAIDALYYVLRFKKSRTAYIVIFAIVIMIVLSFPQIRQFLESALLLNKYGQDATLNQFSSGRLESIDAAIEIWKSHPWIGVGQILVDCNPIAILTDSGILGAIPYFVIWITAVKMNLQRKGSDPFIKATQMLTVYYCVTSLLEGYPPFGPGVCVAPLWLLSGYMELNYGGGKVNEDISSGNSHYTNI